MGARGARDPRTGEAERAERSTEQVGRADALRATTCHVAGIAAHERVTPWAARRGSRSRRSADGWPRTCRATRRTAIRCGSFARGQAESDLTFAEHAWRKSCCHQVCFVAPHRSSAASKGEPRRFAPRLPQRLRCDGFPGAATPSLRAVRTSHAVAAQPPACAEAHRGVHARSRRSTRCGTSRSRTGAPGRSARTHARAAPLSPPRGLHGRRGSRSRPRPPWRSCRAALRAGSGTRVRG